MPTEAPLTLINAFEVPPSEDDAFLALFARAREFLSGRGAYREPTLHRALRPDADFRFVNVARWSSPLAFGKAVQQPAFQELAAALAVPAHPALYQVIGD